MSKKVIDNLENAALNINDLVNQAAKTIAESENEGKPVNQHRSVEDIYKNIQEGLNSTNEITKEKALKQAAAFTSQLTQLVLRQTIDLIDLSEKENKIISKFQNYEMNEGNTYQFILTLNTGIENYHDTPFVPQNHTDPQIEVKNCSWEKAPNQLGDNSFQWHKMLSLRAHEWVIYFKSNTLSEFIGAIRKQMIESITLMKRAKIQKFIQNLTIAKQITGANTNVDCYDSFVELLDHIDSMQFDGQEYCISSTSKNIKAAKKSDILLLINKKTLNLLRTGIKARLTNPGAFDLSNVIDMDNVVEFHKTITDNVNTSTVITTTNTDVIAPDTIIAIDKNALILIHKLFFSGQQLYHPNMTLQLDIHYWFMIDFLPWRKAFKFTDTKLLVVPQ